MKYITAFVMAMALLLLPLGSGFSPQPASAAPTAYSGHPTIRILDVGEDSWVSIRAYNLPDDDEFRVRMGEMGTRGRGGTIVGSFETGDGGSMKLTFDIPDEFQGDNRIAIRIESKTGSGYFAYNWFYNSGSGSDGSDSDNGYTGYPTIRISSVVRNDTVTIRARNLPEDDEFRVLMGRYGTRGVGGIRVTTFDTGAGGNQTFTFDIPADLQGLSRIAIRIQSTTGSGYFAYNWFYNRTTP